MVNNISCNCEIRPQGGFKGWDEFGAFVKVLEIDPIFMPISVSQPYSGVGFMESWYRCTACLATWRLVEPDPPFTGLWARIEVNSINDF